MTTFDNTNIHGHISLFSSVLIMDKDIRYQWIESRIITTLEPKRDAILQLIENQDNRYEISLELL